MISKNAEVSGESALVIRVPEAEELVAPFRFKYDPVAIRGVPAHITLIYPFMQPKKIDAEKRLKLKGLFATFSPFVVNLIEVRRFPDILYLYPSPVETIVGLIIAITKSFPDYPPYGGRFTEIIPHLTVAQTDPTFSLETIAMDFELQAKRFLPIHKNVDRVSLLVEQGRVWSEAESFEFAPSQTTNFA